MSIPGLIISANQIDDDVRVFHALSNGCFVTQIKWLNSQISLYIFSRLTHKGMLVPYIKNAHVQTLFKSV